MEIRVAYIITPTFGSTWSGTTHRIFSLISGWHEDKITLDLLGTELKVLNSNSGEREYKLSGPIWNSPHHKMTFFERLKWTLQILWLFVSQGRNYDIFHFMTIGWGALLSPVFLHPFGKKTVFSMTRYGYNNPSYLASSFRGKNAVRFLRRFDGITVLAQAFLEDCQKHGFKTKILVLPNFLTILKLECGRNIKDEEILRSELVIPFNAQVLLFVGSDHKRKGLDIVVDAFIQLADKYPEIWLFIIGPGSKSDHTSVDVSFLEIQKLKLKEAGLHEHVVWTGMIKDLDRLARYYSAADIMIFPTRGEGLGNVIIEAMYAGLPIVVSNLPGITDTIITHGKNGYLVEVDDTQGFVDSIDTLIKDPDLREKMGKYNQQKAEVLFSFETYCRKLKDFYLEIINT